MSEPLRPLNLGGILDCGVQVFRAQPLLFFGLGAIPGLLQLAFQLASVHPKTLTGPNAAHIGLEMASYGASFIFWVAQLVFGTISNAAICLAASRVNLGQSVTIRGAFSTFVFKAGRVVGLTFLQGIYAGWPLIFVGVIAAIVGIAVGSSPSSIYFQAPIWILASIPYVALYTRYALAFPITAVEDLPAGASIDRSVSLGEGGRWRICGGFLVPLLPSLMLTLGTGALLGAFKHASPLLAGSPLVVAGINGIVELLSTLLFTPYSAIVLTLLYYDQRIRREGYDVERMMESAGLNPTSTPQPAQASLPQSNPEPSQS